jgi:hypothetical protein
MGVSGPVNEQNTAPRELLYLNADITLSSKNSYRFAQIYIKKRIDFSKKNADEMKRRFNELI